ncbi:RhoGAP-domain-containing protein [Obba rivulosa]|uniref:RhoGAP-domain-containing protein n=1 Tax=Obba rivulosa TaxID=1052685 RepID=A0A8E2B0T8_9APHY|nr:RhoGAP-domain-containing protein [Obba rivulosa]
MASNTPTLKQRLAALSTSFPRSDGSLQSPSSWRRPSLFSRRSNEPLSEEHQNLQRLQDVMNKLIFQAGVDFETRPMVVINASALPDPDEVNYDMLLARILSYLNLYVEADYTVVFFAAGGRHTPGWNWVWKAYRSLSRKYRKNLKRLFIVHSNFFTKMLFSLAGTIISPKFFRKITYVDTLSDLAYLVPLTQIDIPPAVYQENLKHEKQINLPTPTRADLFGVPLEELMGYHGEKGGLPRVVKDCIQYLRMSGMHDEGLFRRSPNSALLKQVQQAYDRGHVVSLESFTDPHLAAVLLKKYLRDLPTPVFPESLYSVIRRCPAPTSDPNDMDGVMYLRETLLPELPPCVYILLSHVLHLLHDVSLHAASNRMDAHNLSVVISPNLVSSPSPVRDVMMCSIPSEASLFDAKTAFASAGGPNPAALAEGKTTLGMIIKLCITRYYEVFDDVPDRAEARAAPSPIPSRPSPDPFGDASPSAPTPSGLAGRGPRTRDSLVDDDEDIDDAMLVMPIGPAARSPPSAWSVSGGARPGHRSTSSRDARSTATGAGTAYAHGTVGKARSTISIEKGSAARRGSISVGRGTSRKSPGSNVEALGVTASGFFAPPDAPPIPPKPAHARASRS